MNNEHWIYLDYNASTPMAAEVVTAMKDSLDCQGHPSSPHPHGKKAAEAIDEARRHVATALGCSTAELIFCSGSTEASNHVIKGVCFSAPHRDKKLHFITSSVDHAATIEPLKFLQGLGHEVTQLAVDSTGRIDPQHVKDALRDNTVLVTLIHAQNEVGTVQPLAEVGNICQQAKVLFHVDASQSFGKVAVNVDELKADFLNIAGHKIYGPKGIGALYLRAGRQLEPLLHGGGHEGGSRSGTPAPQLIVGLGKACQLVSELGLLRADATEELWSLLTLELADKVRRNGHSVHRVPNVLHLTFADVEGRELLDKAQISASTGAACHSASVSPVLSAMTFSAQDARGSVRLSLGRQTDLSTAREAARAIVSAYAELRSKVVI